MKDNREYIDRYAGNDPYKVPEGYFERFHEQLMQSLPETRPTPAPATKVTLMARIKPWLYMAATFVGIIFMVQGLMYVQESRFPTHEVASASIDMQELGIDEIEELYAEEIDRFMSSSLYDEYVLYSYLTTDDYE